MGPPVQRRGRRRSDSEPDDASAATAAAAAPSAASAASVAAAASAAAAAAQPFELRQRVGLTEMSFMHLPGSEVYSGVAFGPTVWIAAIALLLLLLAALRLFSAAPDA